MGTGRSGRPGTQRRPPHFARQSRCYHGGHGDSVTRSCCRGETKQHACPGVGAREAAVKIVRQMRILQGEAGQWQKMGRGKPRAKWGPLVQEHRELGTSGRGEG